MARLRNRMKGATFREVCEEAGRFIPHACLNRDVDALGDWLKENGAFQRRCHELRIDSGDVLEYFSVGRFGYMDR